MGGPDYKPDKLFVVEVIRNPEYLDKSDMQDLFESLGGGGDQAQIYNFLATMVLQEMKAPFKDPREFRHQENQPHIQPKELLYMMIDETPQTFREGMIVTATVQRLFENAERASGNEKAICRLENGLQATISAKDILEAPEERLKDKLEEGHSVTGRIQQIVFDHDKQFEVRLECKQKSLAVHDLYLERLTGLNSDQVPEEDRKNANF